jgi:hypothetical protein
MTVVCGPPTCTQTTDYLTSLHSGYLPPGEVEHLTILSGPPICTQTTDYLTSLHSGYLPPGEVEHLTILYGPPTCTQTHLLPDLLVLRLPASW